MAFVEYTHQQISIEDSFLNLSERTKKFILNSWAKPFADLIFPEINEKRFAVLYSDNDASRPNNPVNAMIGALILKEMFNLTDEELLESIICDSRFQYALHTTSFIEQPFSDRSFSRFRERLYLYTLETGIDLLHEEMEAMAKVFVKYMGVNPTVKRMDSLMVSSSCKKMSRLEILYTTVANMVKKVDKSKANKLSGKLEHYLASEDRNKVIYHRKNEEISSRLQQVIDDAAILVAELEDEYSESTEYQLLVRVLAEQTELNSKGKKVPKDKKQIKPTSLQNPSDPDATYRFKAGKSHKGYVGNIVETFDENGAIITAYDYQKNNYSDSQFCKDTVKNLGLQDKKTLLLADGAYASVENFKLAFERNIELITTALLGKSPNNIHASFQLDTKEHKVIKCPAGYKPNKTSYYQKSGLYRAIFNRNHCKNCSLRDQCGAKLQKKSAYVNISEKMVQRAQYLIKLSSEEYKSLSNKRNGVEGVPSVLRRRYSVDQIPVRGLVRSKIWFSCKIGAINVNRVIKVALTSKKTLLLRDFFFGFLQILRNQRSILVKS